MNEVDSLGLRIPINHILTSENPSVISVSQLSKETNLPFEDLGFQVLDYSYIERALKTNKFHNEIRETNKRTTTGITIKNLIFFAMKRVNSYKLFEELHKSGLTAGMFYDLCKKEFVSFEYVELIHKVLKGFGVEDWEFFECGYNSTENFKSAFEQNKLDLEDQFESALGLVDKIELNNKYKLNKNKSNEIIVESVQREDAKEIYKKDFYNLKGNDYHRLGVVVAIANFSKDKYEFKLGRRVEDGHHCDEFIFKPQ